MILPLQSTDALAMGMRTGPPPEAPPLERPVRVIGGARGAIDRSHVAGIRLIMPKRSAGRRVVLGDPSILRGADPGREAYRSIVDGFGQYTRRHWGGKITSREDLDEARQREKKMLREWVSVYSQGRISATRVSRFVMPTRKAVGCRIHPRLLT